jgi:hypothetical protein
MDEVVKKVAALGLPGVLLVITLGDYRVCRWCCSHNSIGGTRWTFWNGRWYCLLGIAGLVADALAKVGIDGFLTEVYRQRRHNELINSS